MSGRYQPIAKAAGVIALVAELGHAAQDALAG